MLDLFSHRSERVQAYLRRHGLKLVLRYAKPEKCGRDHIHAPRNVSELIADAITSFVGSWKFVAIHAVWFGAWILLRFEPFPFGLLTLLVSLEAIFLSTFVMMSQNRAATKDHIRDDHEADEVEQLFIINQQQLEILQTQQETLKALHEIQEVKRGTRRKVG